MFQGSNQEILVMQLAGVSRNKEEKKDYILDIKRQMKCRPAQVLDWLVVDRGQNCKNEDRENCQGLLAHQTNPNSSLLFSF